MYEYLGITYSYSGIALHSQPRQPAWTTTVYMVPVAKPTHSLLSHPGSILLLNIYCVLFCHATVMGRSYFDITFQMLCTPTQSQRQCFDVYVVHLESVEPERVIESDWIIPSLNISDVGGGKMTLNVTTNSTLSTNTFYNATLITAMDMTTAGNIQFCKFVHLHHLKYQT